MSGSISCGVAASNKRWAKNPQLNAFVRGVTAAVGAHRRGRDRIGAMLHPRHSDLDDCGCYPWCPRPLEGAGADLDS
jgi:hypothetical protein